jgi:hypothetical protein
LTQPVGEPLRDIIKHAQELYISREDLEEMKKFIESERERIDWDDWNNPPTLSLLDTVAVIAILEDEPSFVGVLPPDAQASVPIITMGELYAAAQKSGRVQYNLQRFTEFASRRKLFSLLKNTL